MICRLLIRSLHRVFSFFFFLCCSATVVSISGRNLCTDSNKVHEPFKVEEAETVNVPPPPTEKVFYQHNRMWNILYMRFLTYNLCWMLLKLLVLGGNGFVGSHICREALDRGLSVASLSRFFFLVFVQLAIYHALCIGNTSLLPAFHIYYLTLFFL